jgi:hypothetical protein
MGLAPTTNLSGTGPVQLGSQTLTPGVYKVDAALLTGTLILNFQGNPNAVFVFQIGSTLTTASGASVVAINTGSGSGMTNNVYWQVGSSATLGTNTTFVGNILALTDIHLQTGTIITCGRALARNGVVTMDTNAIKIT